MNRVFVYGTLLSGHGNHPLMDHVGTLVSEYKSPRLFDMKSFCRLPILIPGSWHIEGELYDVDEAGLNRLDWFEGDCYERTKIEDFHVYLASSSLAVYITEDFSNNLIETNEETQTKAWDGL